MSLDPAFLLTALGLLAAALVARHRAARFGLEVRNLHSLMRWLLVGVLAGGHLIDALYYRFDQVVEVVHWEVIWREPLELLRLWHGWRSVGGLFGGVAAALLWKRYRFESTVVIRWRGWFEVEGYWFVRRTERVPLLALADVVLSVFPLAWALHRVGSALAHDGPDIGLLDLLITTVLLAVVVALWKGRFRAGFYVCLAGLTYAPARVALDFLSASAQRAPDSVGPLTLTQWGFALATLLSLGLLIHLRWSSLTPRPGVS
jgi:prolipoprotein diacylglyceryltransferase